MRRKEEEEETERGMGMGGESRGGCAEDREKVDVVGGKDGTSAI